MKTPSKKILTSSALNMIKGGVSTPVVKEEEDASSYTQSTATTRRLLRRR